MPSSVLSRRCAAIAASCLLVGAAGCSRGPTPEVAVAYANRDGFTVTSRFTPCPELDGVWNMREPSSGTRLDTEGRWLRGYPVPHYRWVGPSLFGLTPSLGGVVAALPLPSGGTKLFYADKPYTEASPLPAAARSSLGFRELPDAEFPCVGAGWRRAAVHDHSANDAAANVLKLDTRRPRRITQADHMALTPDGDMLIGVHVQYSGTASDGKAVGEAYWHFLKLPRLAKEAKAAGFSGK